MSRARLPLVVLGAALLAYAALSFRHLDAPDRLFVVDAPALPGAPRIVAPGWRFAPRLLYRVSSYPAAPVRQRVDLSGEAAARTREGSRVDIDVDLTWAIPPEGLLRLHASHGPGFEKEWLEGLVARAVADQLASVSYERVRDRDPELIRALGDMLRPRLEESGIAMRGLRLVQTAAPGESTGEILRADAEPLDRDVVLIGVDSFDWSLIDALVAEGRMPGMARLIRRGARANLRTIRPILSPVIWTSIATGVKPSRHGIADFVVTARDTGALVPVTSVMRQVPALWNLASRQGIDVSVVAWWATWPAETVRGSIVTDRVAFQLFEDSIDDDWRTADPERNKGKTWPEGLFEQIRPLIRVPSEVSDEEVGWFLPGGRLPASLTPDQHELLNTFRTVIAAGQTYHAIALRQLAVDPHGLKLFYYQGPDEASHLFMRYRPPLLEGVDRADMDLFGGVVEKYYERQDRYIGELVAAAGDDATILIVSDHGFKAGANRPPNSDPRIGKGDAAGWHTPVGVLLMAGPGIRPGVEIDAASVLDVTPTILSLYGLPVARDMDGQPLPQAFDPDFVENRPVAWIDSYGGARPAGEAAASAASPSPEDAEMIEKLRSLGYIGDDRLTAHNNRGLMALDEGDVDGAIADFERALTAEGGDDAAPMIRTNLAGALLRRGETARARSLAGQVLDQDPRSKQALLVLALADVQDGDLGAAEGRLRRAIDIDPTWTQAIAKLGEVLQREGKDEEALAVLRKAVEIAPLGATEWLNMGNIHRERGDIDRAMEMYREALRADARHIGACNNLGLLLQEKGRLDEARALYGKALQIRPDNPILLNSLGTLRSLQGDPDDAIAQFRRAVEADPEWPVARGNLATLLFEAGRFDEANESFREAVRLEPGSIEMRLGLALSYLMLQKRPEAIAQFEEVLRGDPDNFRARVALGETCIKEGNLEEAQTQLERAARIDGRVPRVFNNLGEVYLQRGMAKEAAAAFERSLALDPSQDRIRRRLAEARR